MAEPNHLEDLLAREPTSLPGGVIAALCAPLALAVFFLWIYLLIGITGPAQTPVTNAPAQPPIERVRLPPFPKKDTATPREPRPIDVDHGPVPKTFQQILTADAKFLLSVEGIIDRTGKELPNRLRVAHVGGQVFADREFDRGLIRGADLSADGKLVVVGFVNDMAGEACIWEPAAHFARAFPGGPTTPVTAVAISADGRWCAAGTRNGVIYVGDLVLAKRHAMFPAHSAAVTALAFSHDGKSLASGGSDKTMRICHVGSSVQMNLLPGHTLPVTSLKYSPDGLWLASGAAQSFPHNSELRLWHTGKGTGKNLGTGSGVATAFTFSPDSSLLAVKTQSPTFGMVTLYNVWTENWLASQRIENKPQEFRHIDCLAFTADGQKLVWATNDLTMAHWDLGAREKQAKAAKAERDKLQGTWAMTEGTTDGKPASPDFAGKIKIIFANSKCEIVMPDKQLAGTYNVTGKSKPGQIEITTDAKVMHGIYEIQGDTLKLCLIDGDQPRPTEFQSEPGSRVMYLVLKGGQAANDDKDK
jgi:uncharacterized protein (TIGR03067 family)